MAECIRFVCDACGAEVMVDSREPTRACPSCGAEAFVDTFELDGRTCPACKAVSFVRDPESPCIP